MLALLSGHAAASTEIFLKTIPVPVGSPEAEAILEGAVMTATVVEVERRKHPKNSFAEGILGAVQKMTFIDDFNYAAHFDPSLKEEDNERSFQSVLAGFSEKSTEELKQSLAGVAPLKLRADLRIPESPIPNTLLEVYGRFVGGRGRFGEVYQALSPLRRDVLQTDLFKDACSYLGLHNSVDSHIKFIRQDLDQIAEDVAQGAKAPEKGEQERADLAQIRDAQVAQAEEARRSIHLVFAFRFQHIHGMDEEVLFERLSTVGLDPNALAIRIPTP